MLWYVVARGYSSNTTSRVLIISRNRVVLMFRATHHRATIKWTRRLRPSNVWRRQRKTYLSCTQTVTTIDRDTRHVVYANNTLSQFVSVILVCEYACSLSVVRPPVCSDTRERNESGRVRAASEMYPHCVSTPTRVINTDRRYAYYAPHNQPWSINKKNNNNVSHTPRSVLENG